MIERVCVCNKLYRKYVQMNNREWTRNAHNRMNYKPTTTTESAKLLFHLADLRGWLTHTLTRLTYSFRSIDTWARIKAPQCLPQTIL